MNEEKSSCNQNAKCTKQKKKLKDARGKDQEADKGRLIRITSEISMKTLKT